MKNRLTKIVKNSKYSLSGFLRFGVLSQYKHVLILGGSNPFGSSLISAFSETWKVTNIDYASNEKADLNILLNKEQDITERVTEIESEMENFTKRYESIICVSSGFVQGSIKDKNIFKQYEQMEQEQVIPSLVAGHLAYKFLAPNGLIVYAGGALPFKQACPSALAYGVTKHSIHSIALNLAEKEELSNDITVVTVLPELKKTTETEEQRNFDAVAGKPQEYEKITKIVKMWADGRKRPINGTFMNLKNINDTIVPEYL